MLWDKTHKSGSQHRSFWWTCGLIVWLLVCIDPAQGWAQHRSAVKESPNLQLARTVEHINEQIRRGESGEGLQVIRSLSRLPNRHERDFSGMLLLPDGTPVAKEALQPFSLRAEKQNLERESLKHPSLRRRLYVVHFIRENLSSSEWQSLSHSGVLPLQDHGGGYTTVLATASALVRMDSLGLVDGIWQIPRSEKGRLAQTGPALIRVLGPFEAELQGFLEAKKLPFYRASGGLFVVYRQDQELVDFIGGREYLVRIPVHAIAPGAVNLSFLPSHSRELAGSGPGVTRSGNRVTIGLLDTGVKGDHPALTGRILGVTNDGNGHGTHVAGILAASPFHGLEYQGMVPQARVYSLNFSSTLPPEAFERFRNQTSRLVNNSWQYLSSFGNPLFNYDGNTELVDWYADDQSIDVASGTVLPGLVLFFISGNSGNRGVHSIVNPGTGKNVITVGAIDYTVDGAAGIGRVTSYSSIGPTFEGRLKPELVAPGGAAGPNDRSVRQAEHGVVSTNANGSINDPDLVWPDNPMYTRLKGTSMATPHVTGAAALLVDYWEEQDIDWTPNDVKAFLINSAIPLHDNGDDPASGFASVRAGYGLVNPYSNISDHIDEFETLLWARGAVVESQLTEETWEFEVPAGAKELHVTLAYSDLPGINLIDDLDLQLIDPNNLVHDYRLPIGVTQESPIEKISVVRPIPGTWRARVIFADWSADPLLIATQRYSLVAQVIKKTPQLNIAVLNDSLRFLGNQDIQLQLRVENTGGFVAAGTVLEIEDPTGAFQISRRMEYVGNLRHGGDGRNVVLSLRTPSAPGTYRLNLKARSVNKNVPEFRLPLTIDVEQLAAPELTITRVRPFLYRVVRLTDGSRCYIDRLWTIQGIPANLSGEQWIQTSYFDRQDPILSPEFFVNQPCSVFVAHDPRITPPAWLSTGFRKTGARVTIVESQRKHTRLDVWAGTFSAGKVQLGPNGATSLDHLMYLVAVKPVLQPVPRRTASLFLPPEFTVEQGDTLTIPVYASLSFDATAFQIAFDYNRNVLSFVDVVLGADLHNFFISSLSTAPGFLPRNPNANANIVITAESSQGIRGDNLEILRLRFVAVGANRSTSPVAVDPDPDHTILFSGAERVTFPNVIFYDAFVLVEKSRFLVQGSVTYRSETANPVENVVVEIASDEFTYRDTTDTNGLFAFENLRSAAYTVTPLSGPPAAGALTAEDLNLVYRHLAYALDLPPEQLSVADCDSDDVVTGVDAVAIRNFLNGSGPTAGAGQWRFAPPKAVLQLFEDMNISFKAWVMGDVTRGWPGSAPTAGIAAAFGRVSTDRMPHPLSHLAPIKIALADVDLEPDTWTEIPIVIRGKQDYALIQLILEYDPRVVQIAEMPFSIVNQSNFCRIVLQNRNLPFPPRTRVGNSSALVLLECDFGAATLPDSVLLSLRLRSIGVLGDSTRIHVDTRPNHSFVVSRNLELWEEDNLQYHPARIRILDLTPPRAFTLQAPQDSAWLRAAIPTFRWEASADEGSGLKGYELVIDDTLRRFIAAPNTVGQPDRLLQNGIHTWYVEAVDNFGLRTRSTETRVIIIDYARPVSTILSPASGDTIEADRTTILAAASDSLSQPAAGVKRVQVSMDDQNRWYDMIPDQAGLWKFDWTGIAFGSHRIWTRAEDNLGNMEFPESPVILVRADRTPPTAFALVSPPDSHWTASATPTFKWQASSDTGSGLAAYRLVANGRVLRQVAASVTSTTPENPLPSGLYEWYVVAIDGFGLETASLEKRTLFIDHTPPVSRLRLAPVDTFQVADTTLTCLAADTLSRPGSGVIRVEISLDGGQTWQLMERTAPGSSEWRFRWQSIPFGRYQLLTRAMDALGNQEAPQDTHIVIVGDFTPPARFTLVAPGDSSWTAEPRPRLAWQASEGASYYNLYFDGRLLIERISADSTSIALRDSVADGPHTWTVEAVDEHGNRTPAAATYTFFVDTTPPRSLITFPLANASYAVDSVLVIRGVASDSLGDWPGSGVELVEISVDSGRTWHPATPIRGDFSEWEYTWLHPAQEGHFLLSRARDRMGHVETPAAPIYVVTAVETMAGAIPERFDLSPVYPNPISLKDVSATGIRFVLDLPEKAAYTIMLYNVRGQLVASHREETPGPGRHRITWRIPAGYRVLAPGVYFVRVRTERLTAVRKVLILP